MPLHWRFKVRRWLAACPETRNRGDFANALSLKEFLCSHDIWIESTVMTHKQNEFLVLGISNLNRLLALLKTSNMAYLPDFGQFPRLQKSASRLGHVCLLQATPCLQEHACDLAYTQLRRQVCSPLLAFPSLKRTKLYQDLGRLSELLGVDPRYMPTLRWVLEVLPEHGEGR